MIGIDDLQTKIDALKEQALGLRIAAAKANDDHKLLIQRLSWAADLADHCAADLQSQIDRIKQVA
ncbi:MAG: hypothetical protein CTY21_09460 [Methylomonas sp.]|nr:MAG: hypothetical protein CTY21_09460 [Methylomonas sp.]